MSEPRLPDLTRSFERHLRAENKSDRTIETYLEAVRLLGTFLAGRGVRLAEADRAHIEAFLADLLARWKPATAANRYRPGRPAPRGRGQGAAAGSSPTFIYRA
jgi:site-specific recombinase XerD